MASLRFRTARHLEASRTARSRPCCWWLRQLGPVDKRSAPRRRRARRPVRMPSKRDGWPNTRRGLIQQSARSQATIVSRDKRDTAVASAETILNGGRVGIRHPALTVDDECVIVDTGDERQCDGPQAGSGFMQLVLRLPMRKAACKSNVGGFRSLQAELHVHLLGAALHRRRGQWTVGPRVRQDRCEKQNTGCREQCVRRSKGKRHRPWSPELYADSNDPAATCACAIGFEVLDLGHHAVDEVGRGARVDECPRLDNQLLERIGIGHRFTSLSLLVEADLKVGPYQVGEFRPRPPTLNRCHVDELRNAAVTSPRVVTRQASCSSTPPEANSCNPLRASKTFHLSAQISPLTRGKQTTFSNAMSQLSG